MAERYFEHKCEMKLPFQTSLVLLIPNCTRHRMIRRKKKYLWFRFPTDPIFFCRPYYFFNAIDRATLFPPGWLPAAAKMASVVTLIIKKTMKKIFKKINYFRLFLRFFCDMKPEPQIFFFMPYLFKLIMKFDTLEQISHCTLRCLNGMSRLIVTPQKRKTPENPHLKPPAWLYQPEQYSMDCNIIIVLK